ncbi:hypothetical protein M9H77_18868 [Catharanthus roseus]|uniref:Uncharacterized protein n=1 Tax=Catharanthus roseus TaxID=4058 RepID=A0ACC0B8M6_CATRO|nr:hypothetical protein M9H77_18868 [Catharanthus roseus]
MEEEYKGEVVLLEKMLQDLAWHVLEEQQEDTGGSKGFLFSRMQMKESTEASLGGFITSKPKEEVIRDLTIVRMEAIGRQEMAFSRVAKARSNCYKDGGYDGNAMEEATIEMDITPIGVMGIGNVSSRAKTFYISLMKIVVRIVLMMFIKSIMECKGSNDFENLVTTSSSFECKVKELWKHKRYLALV